MTLTLKIEGMMCHHCEMHVEKAIMKIDGILSAKADYQNSVCVIEHNQNADIEAVKKTVADEGYKVLT